LPSSGRRGEGEGTEGDFKKKGKEKKKGGEKIEEGTRSFRHLSNRNGPRKKGKGGSEKREGKKRKKGKGKQIKHRRSISMTHAPSTQ